ncbi:Fe(3+)-hydroxamate ABC transporter substrate-binding protein FhuD [Affinibrenneria salicis]|uniref:Fe(3+)-hydroxamate ABC transporter substrate-binding protein FhuD n=1 Tax=Affinibrenneria salicis TaxID=2590031 RepID=A0A5J5FST8_9GAMM|nr:Fe(3+)-hydroxamate ABC transporter substrate-binding protein FhuD [Affinibrenneria salicis]KAA8995497.1 Fe(3+)-hydroxamate ABC transporter substrate-binding protein FhuD [Affinibrenneria salicis]
MSLPVCYPDRTRRRLLTALMLSPLLAAPGVLAAGRPDLQRIVCLEWLPVELLLALDIMPLGVADKHNYRLWVKEPRLDERVVDVGQRTEPNLELLTQLRPSLLLYAQGYGPSPDKMARIAPGQAFPFSDGSGKPLTLAQHSLRQLAGRLAVVDRAERHLAQFAGFMARMQVTLRPYTDRPLLLFSFLDSRHVLVIGKNSLFQEVMTQMAIRNAWQGETNFWGSAVVGIERLAEAGDARALCFSHGDRQIFGHISGSPLWQALPFVRQRRWRRVEAVWPYGATLSAMRFCQVLAQSMEADDEAE